MGIFIIILILCFLCGKFAETKGKSFGKYFLISLIITPIIGFITLLVFQPNTEKLEEKVREIPVKEWIDVGKSKVKLSYFFNLWIDIIRIYIKHYKIINDKSNG